MNVHLITGLTLFCFSTPAWAGWGAAVFGGETRHTLTLQVWTNEKNADFLVSRNDFFGFKSPDFSDGQDFSFSTYSFDRPSDDAISAAFRQYERLRWAITLEAKQKLFREENEYGYQSISSSLSFDSVITTLTNKGSDGVWLQTRPIAFYRGGAGFRSTELLLEANFLNPALFDIRQAYHHYGWTVRPVGIFVPSGETVNLRLNGIMTVTIANGIPEPSAWVMMIAGFGLCGAQLRRGAFGLGSALGR